MIATQTITIPQIARTHSTPGLAKARGRGGTGTFVKGDVVVVPFPFSDLSAAKRRPVLVAALTGDDVILCQITSKAIADSYAIPISDSDFTTGSLRQDSNIRPNRLFTADSNIVRYCVGTLARDRTQQVIEKIVQIVKR